MNILVVRTDKLGDFITALPTFAVLKKHDPKNRVIALVAPLNMELASMCEFIDDVIVDEGETILELSKKIASFNIDASITLFSNTRVAVAQFLARIPKRIAPATKLAQIFYTDRIKQRRSEVKMAEFEYNLELSKSLFSNIDLTFKKPLLTFNENDVYDRFISENNIAKPIVAFHVGFGGSSDANWSYDEYEELINIALKNEKIQVIMTFGPDEEDLYNRSREIFKNKNVVLFRSLNGIVNFCSLISHFKLFVSTSTGTYHLAGLVGTPTMTFFGNSLFASVKRWKTISDELIQHPYMIPTQKNEREELFHRVKEELVELL
ncbi:MAG: lipopolysaccharide heptosyltransferase family protein [Helicobacteraceae bacterium]|nr:lipopolysaccharide heptosyltransferase family protein [Helicobacteraceae bacterium]